MTPKEYAISLGLAKPGKGRMSLAAHAAIDKAISEGTVFDVPVAGQAKAKAVVRAQTKDLGPTPSPAVIASRLNANKVTPWEEGAVNVSEPRYPDSQTWKSTSGFIVSGRTVCTESGFSLQYCSCDKPKGVVHDGRIEDLVLV